MKTESELKSELSVEFAGIRGWLFRKHEDVRTAGDPDATLTGRGGTSHWEFKRVPPGYVIETTRVQLRECAHLDRAGLLARYVIWREFADGSCSTEIADPGKLWRAERDGLRLDAVPAEAVWRGHEIRRLAAEMMAVHVTALDGLRRK